MTMKEMKRQLKKELSKERYQHTINVVYTAISMAMRYEADMKQAALAGLLHDCAKCIPNPKKIKLCRKFHIRISEEEKKRPELLHAKLGACIAQTQYGISDSEILNAIKRHTTGAPGMTLLDKIIYVADYIEPGRDKAKHLTEIRKLAFTDLDACVYQIMTDTLEYLQERGGAIDPMTKSAYDYYDTIVKRSVSE